jgi:hypothetical protein
VKFAAGFASEKPGVGRRLAEFGGFGEGVEGGDGLDEAGNGESVEYAAGFTDEMEHAAFAAEGNGHADERRDARAVNLRYAVKIDDDFAGSLLENGSECGSELVARIANGQATVEVKNADAVLFADVNFNGSVLGHFLSQGLQVQTLKPWKGLP